MTRLHASAVGQGPRGVLILGQAGAGKSALALELLTRGASLIADDAVEVAAAGHRVLARAPSAEGVIEARGIGLLRVPAGPGVVTLIADLDVEPEGRLPEPSTRLIAGIALVALPLKGVPAPGPALSMYLRGADLIPPGTHVDDLPAPTWRVPQHRRPQGLTVPPLLPTGPDPDLVRALETWAEAPRG